MSYYKIFLEYSELEFKLLHKFINIEILSSKRFFWNLQLKNAITDCIFDPKRLIGHYFENYEDYIEMLSMPLSELPLYINDKDPEKAGIAKWRLFIGR